MEGSHSPYILTDCPAYGKSLREDRPPVSLLTSFIPGY